MVRHRGAGGAEELAAVALVDERSAPGVATCDAGEPPHDARTVPASSALIDADKETRPGMTRGLYTAARCPRTAHVAPLAPDC